MSIMFTEGQWVTVVKDGWNKGEAGLIKHLERERAYVAGRTWGTWIALTDLELGVDPCWPPNDYDEGREDGIGDAVEEIKRNCLEQRHHVADDGYASSSGAYRPNTVTVCTACASAAQAVENLLTGGL